MSPAAQFLLVDANVLVDYLATDISVLTLVSRHVGRVHIVSTILLEVEGLDEADCERLGFWVVEPTLEQVMEAAAGRGRLSFQDKTCLAVCRDEGWVCVTNDRALRRACAEEKVPVLWGLEIMVELVDKDQLAAVDAERVALQIQDQNKAFITNSIVDLFRAKIGLAD